MKICWIWGKRYALPYSMRTSGLLRPLRRGGIAGSRDRMPRDLCCDYGRRLRNFPQYVSERLPTATFISAGSAARDAFGCRYGSEVLELNKAMIDRILAGEQLVVEIEAGEHVLFIEYRNKELNVQ